MDQVKIGNFITKCRKEKNLTQQQLADILNVSNRAVSKWETGKNLPDASLMIELCKNLEITVNELFAGERLSEEEKDIKADENLVKIQKHNEATNMAARICFIMTILFLLIYNVVNVVIYGVDEAIDMPAFIIMSALTTIWMIVYCLIINKKK